MHTFFYCHGCHCRPYKIHNLSLPLVISLHCHQDPTPSYLTSQLSNLPARGVKYITRSNLVGRLAYFQPHSTYQRCSSKGERSIWERVQDWQEEYSHRLRFLALLGNFVKIGVYIAKIQTRVAAVCRTEIFGRQFNIHLESSGECRASSQYSQHRIRGKVLGTGIKEEACFLASVARDCTRTFQTGLHTYSSLVVCGEQEVSYKYRTEAH